MLQVRGVIEVKGRKVHRKKRMLMRTKTDRKARWGKWEKKKRKKESTINMEKNQLSIWKDFFFFFFFLMSQKNAEGERARDRDRQTDREGGGERDIFKKRTAKQIKFHEQ